MSGLLLILYGAGFYLTWSNRQIHRITPIGLAVLFLQNLFFTLAMRFPVFASPFGEMMRSPIITIAGAAAVLAGLFMARKSLGTGHAPAGQLAIAGGERMTSLIIPRNKTNSFTEAERERDEIYARIEERCAEKGAMVIGFKSQAHSAVVWSRFDFVLPSDSEAISLRAHVRIQFERFDFHHWPVIMTVAMTRGDRARTVAGVTAITDDELDAIIDYLTGARSAPPKFGGRVRQWPLQLWRPRNKVERIARDWKTIGLTAGALLTFLIPYAGILIGPVLLVLLWLYQRKRPTYVLTTGRPQGDPRQLVRMDSWQVNLERMGPLLSEIRETVMEKLGGSTAAAEMQISPERIWYPGVDGKVEREQIVVRFRRGMGFVHIESYGDDLYLGWDTHVNAGTWVEQPLQRGIDRETGLFVSANRVVSGWQTPNEYDITDATFLTEWLHGVLSRLIKVKLEELKIDQEVDFTIQRESRRNVLDASEPERETTGSKLQRTPFRQLRREG